ncbi:MAG: hypothetical protein A2Z18_01180 [Armatimonadetes bacterium RBG_16_58_9]|nr:MAG: hypothetical protein A2Z18_01180 [Armatimonadetes bacterium RBG_16_58_9]
MRLFITLSTTLILACPAFAANRTAPVPARVPEHADMVKLGASRTIIGPAETKTVPGEVKGTLAAFVNPPREVSPKTVEVFAGDKSIGTSSKRPYMVEFDTTTVPDGELVLKAVARDENGADVWTGTATITVRNSGQPAAPEPTAPIAARPAPEAHPVSQPLTQTYSNKAYDMSIRYPAGWIAVDETAHMRPKLRGGFWIVLGSDPIDKSQIVINIRRRELEPTTDADVFAKYNDYVLQWERAMVLGSPAFVTTSGAAESRRVTHRKIVIKDGCAWMLNCIDKTGKPASESRALFDAMVNTLKPLTESPAVPNVTGDAKPRAL